MSVKQVSNKITGLIGSNKVFLELVYDQKSPWEVLAKFKINSQDTVLWIISRELLIDALQLDIHHSAGYGDISFTKTNTLLNFTLTNHLSPGSGVTISFPISHVHKFVSNTLELVPLGDESNFFDIPNTIDEMFEID